jgi:xylulokinase
VKYFIGIDLGTSSAKSILMDSEGKVAAQAQYKYGIHIPETGWAEQPPELWWNGVAGTIKTLLQTSNANPASICGIGLSGQMHGLVMIDEQGQVVRPAIIWSDPEAGPGIKYGVRSRRIFSKNPSILPIPSKRLVSAQRLLQVSESESIIH